MHDNARHTSHFVVIGNHLAQHPTLSALALLADLRRHDSRLLLSAVDADHLAPGTWTLSRLPNRSPGGDLA
ncbi:hypothetical protein ACFV2H_40540 [Streptomyces sp. NPDC059629]|uniref:hypothetical protein n=1 Tax=Streptomyces sp. NPDC059629 TaxID=3346889 RepID=UPI0036CAF775